MTISEYKDKFSLTESYPSATDAMMTPIISIFEDLAFPMSQREIFWEISPYSDKIDRAGPYIYRIGKPGDKIAIVHRKINLSVEDTLYRNIWLENTPGHLAQTIHEIAQHEKLYWITENMVINRVETIFRPVWDAEYAIMKALENNE